MSGARGGRRRDGGRGSTGASWLPGPSPSRVTRNVVYGQRGRPAAPTRRLPPGRPVLEAPTRRVPDPRRRLGRGRQGIASATSASRPQPGPASSPSRSATGWPRTMLRGYPAQLDDVQMSRSAGPGDHARQARDSTPTGSAPSAIRRAVTWRPCWARPKPEPPGGPRPRDQSSRVECVVDACGPGRLHRRIEPGHRPGGRLAGPQPVRPQDAGRGPRRLPGRLAREPTPTPGRRPTLIIHGTADEVVPIDQSRRLRDALARAGVEAELVELARRRAHLPAGREGRERLIPARCLSLLPPPPQALIDDDRAVAIILCAPDEGPAADDRRRVGPPSAGRGTSDSSLRARIGRST